MKLKIKKPEKNKVKYEEQFIQFLIANFVAIRYRRNLKDHKLGMIRKNVRMSLKRLMKNFTPKNYIHSFDWEESKEGFEFWEDINKKWKLKLKEIK